MTYDRNDALPELECALAFITAAGESGFAGQMSDPEFLAIVVPMVRDTFGDQPQLLAFPLTALALRLAQIVGECLELSVREVLQELGAELAAAPR